MILYLGVGNVSHLQTALQDPTRTAYGYHWKCASESAQ